MIIFNGRTFGKCVMIGAISLLFMMNGCAGIFKSDVALVNLTCEYSQNPIGIDVARPRLSWMLESDKRGQKQTAYQLLIASSIEKLNEDSGDIWDTEKLDSEQSLHVIYGGESLKSHERYFWKVRVWDMDDNVSEYSEAAWWEMGLTEDVDWCGVWISAPTKPNMTEQAKPAPYFRKAVNIDKSILSARAHVSGVGYYELYVNGAKVSDHVLDPAFTRYDRRVLYETYDITDLVSSGENAFGVILGNGWYNMHSEAVWDFDKAPWRARPAMYCQILFAFSDGTFETIASDSSWKVSTGPILFDSIRSGETYDARLEKPDWSRPAYDNNGWLPVEIVDGPAGKMTAQLADPIKVMDSLTSRNISNPKPGCYVFDMQQNMAGWARLTVSGPAGTKVVMKYGERLNDDGTVDQKESARFLKSGSFQTDTYILKGDGVEVWEPRFTYHGFRYVEVTGLPVRPTIDTLQGQVVHTSFDEAGFFECSSELFNQIQENTRWSYISNFHGYPTDCPHREKNGWTGDAHLAAEQGLLNYSSASAYIKWMNDIKDEQRASGEFAAIIPSGGWGYAWGNGPAWDSAYILIPWYLYQYCGDVRILSDHFEGMKRYVDYLTTKADNHIVSIGLGDWCPADTETPAEVTSTAYYFRDAQIVSKMAGILRKDRDERKYRELAEEIKTAFNKKFYDPATHLYAGGTQTAMSCALYQGLVEPNERSPVLENLVSNVLESKDGHIDTGILGAKYLLNTLTDNGRADVAYTIASQTTYPSWGHWIEQGATTLWESWDGEFSRNHIMFGDISAWFYKTIGGINPDTEQVGFKRTIIKPQLVGDIVSAKAEHVSMYGPIISSWKINDGTLTIDVNIPANTTAEVHVPGESPENMTESGNPSINSNGVKFIGIEGNAAVFSIESGHYQFVSPL